jgi:serine hydrolase FSH1
MRRLRILCLHGFRSSGPGLQTQMRGLAAGLEAQHEFICVDSPLLAQGGSGWWNATPIPGGHGGARRYEGWSEVRAWAVSFFERSGPIDGVFGFSQGAALAALLVGLRATGASSSAEHPLHFSCALLVSGFTSNDPAHAPLYQSRASFALPSLHLIGRADRIVPPPVSLALAAHFDRPKVVEHDGGHVIASTPEVRKTVANFLAERAAESR